MAISQRVTQTFSQKLLAVAVMAAMSCSLQAEETPVRPLENAHAHNDYYHDRPLLDALDHGFCSIEADVFLVKGQLLVGHYEFELSEERTLQKLYLDPLRERVQERGGVFTEEGPPVTLLIDFKSNGAATYAVLRKLLPEYSEMLTVVEGDQVEPNAVTIVISGARPVKEIAADNPRYVGIDGRPRDLDGEHPAHLMPLVSDKWANHFRWRGSGAMPEEEKAQLHRAVKRTHEQGRRLRFWATPEEPKLWVELLDAGVDLIGTDDLGRLQEFLSARDAE